MKANRYIVLILLVLIGHFSFGQQKVNLKWKVGLNDTIKYRTIIEKVDTSYIKNNFSIFDLLPDSLRNEDSLKVVKDGLKKEIAKLNKIYGNFKYVTKIFNKKKDVLEIVTEISNKKNGDISNLDDLSEEEKEIYIRRMAAQHSSTILRGEITKNGELNSFWTKHDQKGLISILFLLPQKNIGVGDVWSVDVDFIQNDQNFICDTSFKKNEIRLVDIKNINDDEIAVIEYDIEEFVKGKYNGYFTGEKKTSLKISFNAVAEFSIKKGRWVTYEGIMTTEFTGIREGISKIRYALIE